MMPARRYQGRDIMMQCILCEACAPFHGARWGRRPAGTYGEGKPAGNTKGAASLAGDDTFSITRQQCFRPNVRNPSPPARARQASGRLTFREPEDGKRFAVSCRLPLRKGVFWTGCEPC